MTHAYICSTWVRDRWRTGGWFNTKCHLTNIGNAIVEIWRSYDPLISTMGFPELVRRHIHTELGPCIWITRVHSLGRAITDNYLRCEDTTLLNGVLLVCLWYIFGTWANLILAWSSNYIHYKVWHEISYPFPNFNGAAVEVWEWISNFISHFTEYVVIYPCWD